jgi:hypothetical protein
VRLQKSNEKGLGYIAPRKPVPERVRARAVAVARAPPAEGPLEDAGAEDATRIICQRCYQAKHYGKLVPLAVDASVFEGYLRAIRNLDVLVVKVRSPPRAAGHNEWWWWQLGH